MLGMIIALLCALTWSCAVILLKFSGASLHPLALNFIKSLLGFPLLLITCFMFEGGFHWPTQTYQSVLLFCSGALGIGISDAIVLRSMRFLRASHVAILECLFSPFVILLSMIFFGERPTPLMMCGGLFIIGSLLFLRDDEPSGAASEGESIHLAKGALLMAAGLFSMAIGIVAVKPFFQELPLFSIVTLRMAGGLTAATLLFIRLPNKRQLLSQVINTPHKPQLFGACFFSSYLSIILWIASYKYLQATVAALLNQTSTVFTVLLAVLFLREKLTREKIFATIAAFFGVVLLSL